MFPVMFPRSKGLQGSFYAFVEARLTERKKSRGHGLSSVFGTRLDWDLYKMYDITCAFFLLWPPGPSTASCNLRVKGRSIVIAMSSFSHCRPYTASFQDLFACVLFNMTFRPCNSVLP